MPEFMTSTQAAPKIEPGMNRDRLLYLLRVAGAPEPKYRHGGRRLFLPADIERIKVWMKSRDRKSTKNEPAAV